MILTRIKVCNFRSFRGSHSVDLQPINSNGEIRPIVLFGGLNGAGKTTLFLAIKLALYGRATGAGGYTSAGYTSFIRSCIHKYPKAVVQPNTAAVQLEFQFGKLGKQYNYIVHRNWELTSANLKETVKIWENGMEQQSLEPDDAQGLLNELVPQGVSDLFFFDGEKIGLLAKDPTGNVLREAFARLYGLDLVSRLRDDLQTHLRKTATPLLNVAADTEKTQREYEQLKTELAEARSQLQCAETMLIDTQSRKAQLEISLRARGGAWGEANHNHWTEAESLKRRVREKKHILRDVIAGVFPFCLTPDTMQELYNDVAADFDLLLQRHSNGTVQHFADSIRVVLDQKGQEALNIELANWLKERSVTDSVFDVTPRTLARIEQVVNIDLSASLQRCEELVKAIVSDSTEVDILEQKLRRAPDKDAVKSEFDEFIRINERICELTTVLSTLQAENRAKLNRAIKLGTILSARHRDSVEQRQWSQSREYAERIRHLLLNYRENAVIKKIEQLEQEFNKEFHLLSRKDRRHFHVEIDPQTFKVRLQSKERGEFPTSQLSEGEKHIYAVAMLVALAKTSQRPLPLVIDSPLFRLDSNHHKKLVENYFPSASHQVVLLSTDEEIDVEAYEALSHQVSHAYLIDFDDTQQESNIVEGYFENSETSTT